MHAISDQISEVAKQLPSELQSEVLDFAQFILARRAKSLLTPIVLDQAWGALPDFPDRQPQGALDPIKRFE